jgi:hypothetical protein
VLKKYESLLKLISASGVVFDLDMVEVFSTTKMTRPILRHDVDFTLVGVKEMAELDKSFGHKSIFLFRPDARSYNLESVHSLELISHIQGLGHEVGLHLDRRSFMANPQNQQATSHYLKYIQSRLNCEINLMSWHIPLQEDLGGNEIFLGLISLYSERLWGRDYYLSDSSGQWSRDREIKLLDLLGEKSFFQLLIHHEWWLDENVSRSFARSYSQQMQDDILELKNQIPFESLRLEESICVDFLNNLKFLG